ncbi:MAG: response regulator [Gammaproteobacteria bacterium]|nr:response regulator [Gammaproteobacteria bacterium]
MTEIMNKPRVLLVDDELNILNGYKRSLRKKFDVITALGGEEALSLIEINGEFPLIISDMRMPNMDGIQLLNTVKNKYPNTIRVMLTGNADQQTAMNAINEGEIYRFHTKPCSPDLLSKTIEDALELYRLKNLEKDLLKNTLRGAISALTEVLSLTSPEAFGRTIRITNLTVAIAKTIGMKDVWFLESLALLSQIGCVVLPDNMLSKLYNNKPLNEEEKQIFEMHPAMGSDIISKIPRMESMAKAIQYQMKNFDGSGIPANDVKGKNIPPGARILHLVIDFDNQVSGGKTEQQAYEFLKQKIHLYDPQVFKSLRTILSTQEDIEVHKITATQLRVGMKIIRNIETENGTLIINRGHEVTPALLDRITVFSWQHRLAEPIYVTLPETTEA